MVDELPSLFENAQLVDDRGWMKCSLHLQSLLKGAGTIDDAGKAPAQHVQQSTHTGQKEYRSDRKLNDVRDLIDLIHTASIAS